MKLRNLFILILSLTPHVSLAVISPGETRIRSADLKIEAGSEISVDGKKVGTAPCEFVLSSNVRHTIELKVSGGSVRKFFFELKEIDKTRVTKNVPAWFLNPELVRGDYPGYDLLTTATAMSRRIDIAISKADVEATAKLAQGKTSVFSSPTGSEYRQKLDSSTSKNYPRRTRGQMDSLSSATGGTYIVTTFTGSVNRTLLQYEIQKIGSQYRAYVLVGKKKE